jgi:uncharacterized OB-fold protein
MRPSGAYVRHGRDRGVRPGGLARRGAGSKFNWRKVSMSQAVDLTVHHDLADAEPRFVAPSLVESGPTDAPRLIGGRCATCGALSFPRAAVCTECMSEDIEKNEIAGAGRVYSYSVVHQAPKGWSVPYALGYVDLTDKVRVLAHIDVPESALAIDMPVRLSVGRVGTGPAGEPLMTYTFVQA